MSSRNASSRSRESLAVRGGRARGRAARGIRALAVPWVMAVAVSGHSTAAAEGAGEAGMDPGLPRPAGVAGFEPRYAGGTAEFPRIEFEAGLVSINDRCPPCGRKLGLKMPPIHVNGRPVGFCCAPCPPQFRESPESQLEALDIHLPCAVDPSTEAVLRPDHRSIVNDEIFFFSSTALKAEFDAAPHWFGIVLTDPLSRERFRATDASPRATLDGRTVYFASAETARRAEAPGEGQSGLSADLDR